MSARFPARRTSTLNIMASDSSVAIGTALYRIRGVCERLRECCVLLEAIKPLAKGFNGDPEMWRAYAKVDAALAVAWWRAARLESALDTLCREGEPPCPPTANT